MARRNIGERAILKLIQLIIDKFKIERQELESLVKEVEIKIPSVSVTPSASSGTKVGTITIDGKSYDLYAPSVTIDSIGAANKTHNHNDMYYTETEIDNKLANKSNNGHTHDYAATNHSHSDYIAKSKITQSSGVTVAGQYVLDAIEKNASIEGTLAHLIAQVNGSLAVEGGRNIIISATCIGGTTQEVNVVNGDSIKNYRNLLFMLSTGNVMLASNVLDKNLFVSGFTQRVFWYDLSYLYYIDATYISDTRVLLQAAYPSGAALGFTIVGFN